MIVKLMRRQIGFGQNFKCAKLIFASLVFASLFLIFEVMQAFAVYPPQQESIGPGGKLYKHQSVKKEFIGTGATGFWLFEPEDPKPENAPVIIFMHGWSATNPATYGAWIDHIVRRGNIVIYPLYQEPDHFRYPVAKVTDNAMLAVMTAFDELKMPGHVKFNGNIAIVGHSAGGLLAANLTALAGGSKYPQPKACMSVEPGKTWNRSTWASISLADLSLIPRQTLLITIVGEDDNIVKDIDAKRIYQESTKVPAENKNFITMLSDNHGDPGLKASHFFPVARDKRYDAHRAINHEGAVRKRLLDLKLKSEQSNTENSEVVSSTDPISLDNVAGSVDALDFNGLWKLFDALCDAAFYGTNRELALGSGLKLKSLGKWSDGVAVKELRVGLNP